jgi:FecR protein
MPSRTQVFVADFPMRTTAAHARKSESRLDATRAPTDWKADRANQGEPKSKSARKAGAAAFAEMQRRFGLAPAAIQRFATSGGDGGWIGNHRGSHETQTPGLRAFRALQRYAHGVRGRPRFKGRDRRRSLEGKSNGTVAHYRNGAVDDAGLVLPLEPGVRVSMPDSPGRRPNAGQSGGRLASTLIHARLFDTARLHRTTSAAQRRRATRCKLALTLLVLASTLTLTSGAPASTQAPGSMRLAQAGTPLQLQPAAPGAAQADEPSIGSVATLRGEASVTRHNDVSALKVDDAIFKGDVLQTSSDGTLGITFDDNTTFTLEPNSRIAIDNFVYQDSGASNAALFNITRGTVAFIASKVAKTGHMNIETPEATLGIRGTTGIVEIPTAGSAGPIAVKLYPDEDGHVGRIEVFARDGARLGVLYRGTSGLAIRPGAVAGRFTAVPLRISALQAARDHSFVQRAFSTQRVGRQINSQRRTFERFNQPRPNQIRPNQPGGQPGLQPRPGQPPAPQQRPEQPPPRGQPRRPAEHGRDHHR